VSLMLVAAVVVVVVVVVVLDIFSLGGFVRVFVYCYVVFPLLLLFGGGG
jgi:hypothetical protein